MSNIIATTARINANTNDLIAYSGEYFADWQYEAEARAEHEAACRAAYEACEAERAAYRAANPIPEGEYTWADYVAFEAPIWAIKPEDFMPEGMEYDPILAGEWTEWDLWEMEMGDDA